MFLDIAVGILGALGFSRLTGAELEPVLVGFAVACALLPDADALLHIVRGRGFGKSAHMHRSLLHYPLLLIPGVFVLVLPFDLQLAVLASLLVTAHFVHDSIGIGWGVAWLYPFDRRLYKLLDDGRLIRWRTSEQVEHDAHKHGDPDWLRHTYLRPSRTLIIELVALAAAVWWLWLSFI